MMINLPNTEQSYWQASASETAYPHLDDNFRTDIVIVGGGITGLTSAYLLKQAGFRVVVLEKNLVGSGTSGKTTGKITSQHGLVYDNLSRRLGKRTARIYAEANQSAAGKVKEIIQKEKIDCDITSKDNYVFTTDYHKTRQFKAEAGIAAALDLPATFETVSDLPFKIEAAVKFSNQAMFNVQKYLLGLARLIHGNGSYVFEHSNVTNFHDGHPAYVKANGKKVTAKDIIVATKIPAAPLLARGGYAILVHPHTSYIVAGRFDKNLKGMYISPDKNHYSILPVKDGRKQLLLIGGENHTPGLSDPNKRYQKLANYAEKYFGISKIEYKWKAMDYIAYDEVPLVGKLYPWSKHLYTATGFKKWGLTTSMVAGTILCDLVQGKKNLWADTFNSMRLKPVTSIPYAIKRQFSEQ